VKLTKEEVDALNEDGAEIAFRPSVAPQPQKPSPPKPQPPVDGGQLACLKDIAAKLDKLISKEQQISVQPPAVTVNPNKPITKWEFVVTKRGDFEKIITATAITQ